LQLLGVHPGTKSGLLVVALLLAGAWTPNQAAANEASAFGATVDGQGRVVAFGQAGRTTTTPDFGVARYSTAGSLDGTFGTGGRARLTFASNGIDEARAGVRSGDRIIAVGHNKPSSGGSTATDFALAAYSADGQVDGGFGVGGTVKTHWGTRDYAEAAVVDGDGRIVVVGSAPGAGDDDVAIARYLPTGELDTSFSGDGKLKTEVSFYGHDTAYAVAMDGDKVVVAGAGENLGDSRDFFILRYEQDGDLDTSFDGDGIKMIDVTAGEDDGVEALVVQPDGKYLLAGYTTGTVGRDFALARMNSDGSPDDGAIDDPTPLDRFGAVGAGGIVTLDFGLGWDEARALLLDPDDDTILVGGHATVADGQGGNIEAAAVAKLLPDGTLDSSFGGGSGTSTDISACDAPPGPAPAPSGIHALVRQGDGGALAIGEAFTADDCAQGFMANPVSDTGLSLFPAIADFAGTTAEDSTTQRPPEAPQLLEPTSGALRGTGPRELRWSAARHAQSYDVYVDDVQQSGTGGTVETSYTAEGLTAGQHTWKVVAENSQGTATSATGTFTLSAGAAQRFRPILRFDSNEKWRPVDIEAFLSEQFAGGERHRACLSLSFPGNNCVDIDDWTDLRAFDSGWGESDKDYWPYIDIHGDGDDADSRHAPDQSCAPGDLLDCDDGSIYWHLVDNTPDAYDYLDYWWFYRYNKFELGDHEADWEGVTVAYPKTETDPLQFTFAGFDSHGSLWYYLRDVLSCGGSLDAGTCGSEGAPNSGQRVTAFVANGSHATYPHVCDAGFFPCYRTEQSGDSELPEQQYDGEVEWGTGDSTNNDPAALKELPDALGWDTPSSAQWTDWHGWWGIKFGINDGWTSHVESPAARGPQERYFRPDLAGECSERWTGDELDCSDTTWHTSTFAAARSAPDRCAAWRGPFVTAAVCDPDELTRALEEGTLDRRGAVHLSSAAGAAGDSAPGIAQLAGEPLQPGEVVTVTGRIDPDTEIVVRAKAGSRVVSAHFTGVTASAGKRTRIRAQRRNGAPVVTAEEPDGDVRRPERLQNDLSEERPS
jgi:uncharacterized delta-60 repeat protein